MNVCSEEEQSEVAERMSVVTLAARTPACIISPSHLELIPISSEEAQSVTMLVIKEERFPRSVAVFPISSVHFEDAPPQSLTAWAISVVAVPMEATASEISVAHLDAEVAHSTTAFEM